MSDPIPVSSPSKNGTGSTDVPTTPGNGRFPASTLKLIAALVVNDPTDSVIQVFTDIFKARGIEDWGSMELENVDDFKSMVETNADWMKVLKDKRLTKLLTVIEYASLGGTAIDDSVSFSSLLQSLRALRDEAKKKAASVSIAGMMQAAIPDPNDTQGGGLLFTPANLRGRITPGTISEDNGNTDVSTLSSAEKFGDIPKLPVFSGEDHDYDKWKRGVIEALATSRGLISFIRDEEKVVQHPETAEGVFYSLSWAMRGGLSASIANEYDLVLEERNPYKLWQALHEYYNTKTSTHTTMMNQIRRLINLKLDASVSATKFLEDWKDCVLRLQEVKATFIEDQQWLIALLYSAIQDEDYNVVLDKITSDDKITVKAVLSDIRSRAEQISKRDGIKVKGDGLGLSKSARRASTNPNSNTGKSGKNQEAGKGWKIPLFPRSWMRGIPQYQYKAMKKWRYEVNQGNNDWEALDEMCALPVLIEDDRKPSSTGGKHDHRPSQSSKSRNHHKKSRRTKSDTNHNDTAVSDAGSETDSSASKKRAPRPPSNKRIRLNYKSKQSKPRVGFVDPNA